MAPIGVKLEIRDKYVMIDNGLVQLELSNPEGIVTRIGYNGVDNLLEHGNEESNRGYWDLVWSDPAQSGTKGVFDVIKSTSFKVIIEDENQVEISFRRSWDPSLEGKIVPLNIDKRFIMLRGVSGFYTYAIYAHSTKWPGFTLSETRVAFKLWKEKFHYMAMADDRKKVMPMPEDRLPGRGQTLAYPEAVLLINPTNPDLKGEVDDKYQYSCNNQENRVHGWICSDPPIGFWQITPSNEFKTGGPVKQNLTSHVGPTTLAVFVSAHYTGEDLLPRIQDNEPWKKVFGPIFIYLNSRMDNKDLDSLWEDAKTQMLNEEKSWPYSFPASEDFLHANQRGSVSGRLFIRDKYIDKDDMFASYANVGLGMPGEAGSWQRESKGYQFWTKTDEYGDFRINNIHPGNYNLFAWVPGHLGDFKYAVDITIFQGSKIELGNVVFEPPRDGPTLWEIGIPDRSAAEFFIPEPNPKYVNKSFVNKPDLRFRQYGLWERYEELFPDNDLVYKVGESDYRKDWFFAQVPRKRKDGNGYGETTWNIEFKLDEPEKKATYKLRVAIASATIAILHVRVNEPNENPPLFTSGVIGKDNSIARHGIHGLYWLHSIDVPGAILKNGKNIIFLKQPRANSPFQGLMYDYIRLEGPPRVAGVK